MRALGPGSVSSFLKIILDVVFAALWIGVAALSLFTLAALLLSFNPDLLANLKLGNDPASAARDSALGELASKGSSITSGLLAAALYLGGILVIVGSLRRIFTTLTAGDPFHPDNVARLRLIGLMLAGLELGRYAFWAVSAWLLPGVGRIEPTMSLTAWFSVLVVFVLAEVFREGARLRREAELTI
ncbi:MAG: DUF2975 domain-containing protein [Alphaproteobacteria bacterium]|nr:DUF2975 domain-containing protein [Alphaproteobacteria bacterium]MBU1516301.1 DUF2975 domain-containing protein [Alphaproteobacteria bacterium]MBU2093141.1 DUF2975 domain-containing protein [Alphaproteobacteria bacterium]MBU2151517.1 DUF2975 domain-containing protein [Alphaproteobacteria bacterium]MBU2306487.1 DUF2975 domain-containing protein [Alphaproteobacteria bacterium]